MADQRRLGLRRDEQQWLFDWMVKTTGRVFHFQHDGRWYPPTVRSHKMISKHVGKVADRLAGLAREEEAKGHNETALDLWFDASSAYGAAQHPIFSNNAEKRELHGRSLAAYRRVMDLAPYKIERVEVPLGDQTFAGYLHLCGQEAAPLIFFIPGCDMTKEMAPNPQYNYALQRGMHIFVFDGPGQGESNLNGYALTASNYEKATSAALDVLTKQPEVDESQIGLLGLSFGSRWALRAAAEDSRFAAVAAPFATYSDLDYLMSEESPRYKQLFAYLTQAESEAELEQIMSDMTLEGTAAKISCPTLLASGEYDPRSPIEDVYDYFDEFQGNAELWVYADQHHMISVLGRHEVPLWQLDAYPFTMDWLRDRLRGEKFENAGKVAYLEPGGVGPNSDNVSRRRQWFA